MKSLGAAMGLLDDAQGELAAEQDAARAREDAESKATKWALVGAHPSDTRAASLSPDERALLDEFRQGVPTAAWSNVAGLWHFRSNHPESWSGYHRICMKYQAPDGTIRAQYGQIGQWSVPVGKGGRDYRNCYGTIDLFGKSELWNEAPTAFALFEHSIIDRIAFSTDHDLGVPPTPYGSQRFVDKREITVFEDGTVFLSSVGERTFPDKPFFVNWLKELLTIAGKTDEVRRAIVNKWVTEGRCQFCGGLIGRISRKCKNCRAPS
jgi:hypothetical protein